MLNATQEQREKLKSVYETLKRKINPVKNIEDKIINVLSSEKLMEHVIMKSNEFKIEAKQQPDMKNTWCHEKVSMRLPKPKIPEFCGDAQKRPEFWIYESCNQQITSTRHQKILTI